MITAVGGLGAAGLRFWESDWFSITPIIYFDFVHNLNLPNPWLCQPRIIVKVKSGHNGWSAGEYVFTDGSNHNGSTAASELGWAISITANGVHVSFGNSKTFICNHRSGGIAILDKTNVECKLVISY